MHLSSHSSQKAPARAELLLIARQDKIEINTVGNHIIPLLPGFEAKNTKPLFAKIVRSDGILNDVSATICLNNQDIKKIPHQQINGIGSSNKNITLTFSDEFEYPKAGDYSLNVTKANGCFATLSISIYAEKL